MGPDSPVLVKISALLVDSAHALWRLLHCCSLWGSTHTFTTVRAPWGSHLAISCVKPCPYKLHCLAVDSLVERCLQELCTSACHLWVEFSLHHALEYTSKSQYSPEIDSSLWKSVSWAPWFRVLQPDHSLAPRRRILGPYHSHPPSPLPVS